jgi:PhoPQ-activated pathogenicity-related protein
VVYQLPNCPVVYPSDPSHKKRTEDAVIAWGWKQYLDSPAGQGDPEWLARLPMTKGAMSSMRAAQEYLEQQKIAEIAQGGWFVAGASKRGWTTWMVGAVTCPSPECPTILGIAPLVPIVPNMVQEIHRQWKAYGGWTFAFTDYLEVNLTAHVDDPQFAEAMAVVDPAYYHERLARLPKQAVVSV